MKIEIEIILLEGTFFQFENSLLHGVINTDLRFAKFTFCANYSSKTL